MMPKWIWVYEYLFKSLFPVLLGVNLKVELLDHVVTGNSTSKERQDPSTVAALFYIPPAMYKGYNFSTSLSAAVISYFVL